MGGWGSRVLNFLVKIHIQLFVLQTSKNVLTHIIHKWGGHISPFHDALRLHRIVTVRDGQKKIHFLRNLSQKRVAMGGWGSRVLNLHMWFWLKNDIFSKNFARVKKMTNMRYPIYDLLTLCDICFKALLDVCSTNSWMCIFTKKFRTLDPHPPIV